MRAKEFITDGIGGQFIRGMTGGQASSLGQLAKLGVAGAADKLGFKTSASNVRQTIGSDEIDPNKLPPEIRNMSAKELADALGLKAGNVAVIGQQRVKITAIDSEGIEGTDLQSRMPVSYPKEALMMMLAKQQASQQGEQP
jgi:hypothetical protein